MKIEDIISCFNKQLQERRTTLNINNKGHLVLLKQIIPHQTFKAYKTIKYTIWYIGTLNIELKTFELKDRIPEGSEDKILNNLDNELIIWLFNITLSNIYNNLVNGNIDGRLDYKNTD